MIRRNSSQSIFQKVWSRPRVAGCDGSPRWSGKDFSSLDRLFDNSECHARWRNPPSPQEVCDNLRTRRQRVRCIGGGHITCENRMALGSTSATSSLPTTSLPTRYDHACSDRLIPKRSYHPKNGNINKYLSRIHASLPHPASNQIPLTHCHVAAASSSSSPTNASTKFRSHQSTQPTRLLQTSHISSNGSART